MKTFSFIKKHIDLIAIFVIIFLWIGLLFFISPEEIVEIIGVERGYLFLFLTAFLGVSGFASTPFYMALVTLAGTGEFNVFLLALTIAPARAFGDSIFFFLGYKIRSDLTNKRLRNFSAWINEKPTWSIPFFAYIYTAMTPFPQDILMVALGVGKVKFRYAFAAVLLGNATAIFLIYILSGYIVSVLA